MKRAKKNRLLAFLLMVTLLVAMLPAVAFAEEPVTSGTSGGIDWNYDNGVLTVSAAKSPENGYEEGVMVDYSTWKDTPWYGVKDQITELIIQSGVETIGKMAFGQLSKLSNITIPDSVESFGDYAFSGCTSLTRLTVPKSVKKIGIEVFYQCYALEFIDVSGENTEFQSLDGVLLSKNGETLIQYPQNKADETYKIPDSVKTVAYLAFNYTQNLKTIDLNNVSEIADKGVYCNQALEEITIKNALKLGDQSFAGNKAVTKLTMNAVPAEMGTSIFHNCISLSEVTLPDDLTVLGQSMFAACTSLSSIQFPSELATIKQGCFDGAGLSGDLVIPESVTEIGFIAFRNCKNLTSITVEAKNPKIDKIAFQFCDNVLYMKGYANLVACLSGINLPDAYSKDDGYWAAPSWFTADGTVINSQTPAFDEMTTQYRVFVKKVELDTNGGENRGNISEVYAFVAPALKDGEAINLPNSYYQNLNGTNTNLISKIDDSKFTREGYEFSKWTGDPEGLTGYDIGKKIYGYMPDAVYAQWKKDVGDTKLTVLAIHDQTYTGKPITPDVIVMNGDDILTEGYTVSYSDNNTNVGEVTATVCVGTTTEEIVFNIVRDENPSVSMADKSVTYGDEYTMTARAETSARNEITGDNIIAIKYYTDADCIAEWTGADGEEQPTAAGTYYAKAVLAGTNNYVEASAIAKLTISNATFSVMAEGYSGIYDGQDHSITVTADGADVTYSTDGKTYSEQNPTFTDAGEYTVYYKAAKANYEDATGSVTVKISKANQVISYSANVEKHINDKAFTNELAQTTVKGKVTYASDNAEVATVNAETGEVTIVGAGTATITAAVAGTDNYNEATATYTLTVSDHSYGTEWESDSTNHWHECTICGDKSDTAAHTFTWVTDKEATAAEKGSKHEECSACGYKKAAVEIPATGNANTETGNTNTGNANTGTGTSIGSSTSTSNSTSTGNRTSTSGSTTSPRTGDNNNLVFWIVLLLLASGGMIGVVVYTRKRRTN